MKKFIPESPPPAVYFVLSLTYYPIIVEIYFENVVSYLFEQGSLKYSMCDLPDVDISVFHTYPAIAPYNCRKSTMADR